MPSSPNLALRTPLIPAAISVGPGNSFWAMICATTEANGRMSFRSFFRTSCKVQRRYVLPSTVAQTNDDLSLASVQDCTFSNGFPLAGTWASAAQPLELCHMARRHRAKNGYAQVFHFDHDAAQMTVDSFALIENRIQQATSRVAISGDRQTLLTPEALSFRASSMEELTLARSRRDALCPQSVDGNIDMVLAPSIVRQTPRLAGGGALVF